ncbi:MAG: CusA/CzcA family heavy metal efflux RND transporter [Methylococcales bacterium]|nr:CusA/CzcA family heavy metal efflux RND transporter [Methylococcales bacterium]
MIETLIEQALKHRPLVLIGILVLAGLGIWSFKTLPLDALPDLSDVQVIVFTEYPGQAPQVVEQQITYPLTTALLSVPKTKVVRGFSFFALSFVYVIFEDGTDIYWARSRVLEALNYARKRLPQGVNPALGPDATGVGWVYEYALVDTLGRFDLAELRSIQDWYLRYPLQTVPGVAEVASVGGFVKQYQIEVDPNALLAYGIPLSKVKQAIQRSNNDVGGRLVEMAETEYMVRGLGALQGIDDLNQVPVGVDANGTPIRVQDIAHVHIGPELRRGVTELDGMGEVVGGVVILRYGANAQATLSGVRAKLAQLSEGLPEGVTLVPVYDRSKLIERAVATLYQALGQELVLVCLLVALFLLHLRSSLVIVITLPLGVLAAFIIMRQQGLNANIMSLGGIAIAIGDMVDGGIVMLENAHRHLLAATARKQAPLNTQEHWKTIATASKEVGPTLFFSLLVITVSFTPIFAMQAQEGRLFSPLAYTKSYAMAAAALLTITVTPVLMGYLVRGRLLAEQRSPANRLLRAWHQPLLHAAMRKRKTAMLLATLALLSTAYPWSRLGSEFMPPLDEGDILYMPSTFPGLSITKARELLQQTNKIIKTFPEVEHVFGKVGRADSATDPAPLSMIETIISLKDKALWPDATKTTQQLITEMDQAIAFPGVANSWSLPIKTRIDMLSTGIKTPVGVKLSGPDLAELQRLAKAVEQTLKTLPETLSAFGDRAVGGYYLDFDIDRQQAARYGLTTGDVQEVIETAIGGTNISESIEGLERYPINLRYPRELRDNLESLQRVLIPTPTGAHIPLALLAKLQLRRGPPVIKSENARPNAWVYVDLNTNDIGGYVNKARPYLAERLKLPEGYTLSWSGQFEYMQRAADRLRIVIPITLLIIFLLLYLSFGTIVAPLIIMLTVPFGLVGGIWLVYLYGFNLSVAVYVGLIALAGTAAETGAMVLNFIDLEIKRLRQQHQRSLTTLEIHQAVSQATGQRLRPIAITVFTTLLGLLPVMWAEGAGADVTQRIAAPVLGGMVSVLLVSLLIFPVVYSSVLIWQESRHRT